MIRLAPFVIVSMFMHGILLVAGVPWTNRLSLPGRAEGSEELLFVEVVAEKDHTAAAPAPASVDAGAARASQREKEARIERDEPKEPAMRPEEPVREPVVEESPLPQPVLAAPSEEPKADFIASDIQVKDPPEPVKEVKEPPETEDKPDTEEQKKPVEREETEKKLEKETPRETPRAVASMPQTASHKSAFRASRGHDMADFKARILAAVKKASYYPGKAVKERRRGEVLVRFRIWRDGRMDGIEVVRSSGSKILDKAAAEILQDASAGFPAVPDFFRGEHLVYAVPIVFRGKLKVRN
ncbi:MAG: TonB family protein [Pseudomonadota bacterium]